ncbi:SNF2 family N-terminal domain-containing protein [Abortiporus biennis]|nr:SNF2 family N-terminal domain-containing protein [Abortiporus biennis]
MSLRHILNDEPNPPPLPAPVPTALAPPIPLSVIDPALTNHSSSPLSPSSSTHIHRHFLNDPSRPSSTPTHDVDSHPARPAAYQASNYQGAGGYNPYTGEWQQDIFPLGHGGNYYPEHDDEPHSPRPNGSTTTRYKEGYIISDGSSKKKRKIAPEDDEDYTPPGRRRGSRRLSGKLKSDQRSQSSALDVVDNEQVEEFHEMTEEERRLASSDLEDCVEVWQGALGEYVLETHKRQKQIDAFFSQWIINRDALTASTLSHAYVGRISRIPPPPPPPVILPSVEDDLIATLRPRSPSVGSVDDGQDMMQFDSHPEDFSRPADVAGGAEDAARELEESVLGPPTATPKSRSKGKGKEVKKRPAVASDESSEPDIPIIKMAPARKRRRVTKDKSTDITEALERSIAQDAVSASAPVPAVKNLAHTGKGKGKGKQREDSVESASVSATPKQRKRGPRKKLDALPIHAQEHLIGSAAASVAGDMTPTGSRPASPALTNVSATIYELDENIPPLKRAKKVDDHSMWKRVKGLEEAQRKVWTNIARRDVVKVYRYHTQSYQARQAQQKRLAMMSSLAARKPYTRTTKATKDIQAKGKRLMREMLVFWKKNEKEERDVRKREQKEAIDRARIEEEKREAARQARKLEFLISQTELYSHFVGNKLKTAEIEGEGTPVEAPAGAMVDDTAGDGLHDIDFDDDDHTNLHRHAKRNAQEAIAMAKRKAQEFDTQAALERKTNEALKLAKGQAHIRDDSTEATGSNTPLVDLDSEELNFQNPTSLTGELTVKQPKMLMATLKEYQLKGLNWLATLYEQGINGILADEMGLGKTVQSISLLAYLAETHDIWGPFLVVSPASTLHNWQQEITRFVPKLKALPYWGNVKDRATLRKFWSKKEISYNEDAPFHVLITSYQLVTQDQQYFQRVKWQYMILDEAQNIKNSSSARWKTLLGFQCRNRLLLTGTPIQNSMQELWALLHFIMPSLFDSHDEFNEWFSKDIENAAENKGSKLNEHQLRRLHMILKPFMLRRVKRHVQNELSDKIEIDIFVDLSARQRALYKALLANVSVADLLEKAANIGDADSARSLMNLVMQFRKVCNHPELFERADVVAPFAFAEFGRSGPLNREGDFVQLPYSTRNPIEFNIPVLFYSDGGLLDVPQESAPLGLDHGPLANMLNIWSTDYIHQSYTHDDTAFTFLRLLDLSPSDAHELHTATLMHRQLWALQEDSTHAELDPYFLDPLFVPSIAEKSYRIPQTNLANLVSAEGLPELKSISSSAWQLSCLSRPGFKLFIPPVVAPPITMYCADRTFIDHQARLLESPEETLALYGVPPDLKESNSAWVEYEDHIPFAPPTGLLDASSADQLPLTPMQVPEAKRLIYDSAKLARLDTLLQELKRGDHKVLVYFQMTRMMDLMEEYLIYRQYKYLRLDGSSKLEDRRDMVMEWQTRPDIFVFLLSTRAGGLGINLTAADTVIFYDHDWNPSNDAQAMDRAHRLGQTRQVTVYRLITKGTIDERIVQLARVKKDVQDIVVGNKNFTDVTKPSEIVQLLLNEDQLTNLDSNAAASGTKKNGKKAAAASDAADSSVRDLWNEEGDEFFGHSAQGQAVSSAFIEPLDDDGTPAPSTNQGKKRRGNGTSTRGRKPGPKAGTRKKAQAAANIDAES